MRLYAQYYNWQEKVVSFLQSQMSENDALDYTYYSLYNVHDSLPMI